MKKKKLKPYRKKSVGHPDENSSEYIPEMREDIQDKLGHETGQRTSSTVV